MRGVPQVRRRLRVPSPTSSARSAGRFAAGNIPGRRSASHSATFRSFPEVESMLKSSWKKVKSI